MIVKVRDCDVWNYFEGDSVSHKTVFLSQEEVDKDYDNVRNLVLSKVGMNSRDNNVIELMGECLTEGGTNFKIITVSKPKTTRLLLVNLDQCNVFLVSEAGKTVDRLKA